MKHRGGVEGKGIRTFDDGQGDGNGIYIEK